MPLSRKKRSARKPPDATSLRRSRFAAEMNRTSTFRVAEEPRRITSPLSSARSTLVCVLGAISPTSSRKRVPPSAASKSPTLVWVAPVNAPFS